MQSRNTRHQSLSPWRRDSLTYVCTGKALDRCTSTDLVTQRKDAIKRGTVPIFRADVTVGKVIELALLAAEEAFARRGS